MICPGCLENVEPLMLCPDCGAQAAPHEFEWSHYDFPQEGFTDIPCTAPRGAVREFLTLAMEADALVLGFRIGSRSRGIAFSNHDAREIMVLFSHALKNNFINALDKRRDELNLVTYKAKRGRPRKAKAT